MFTTNNGKNQLPNGNQFLTNHLHPFIYIDKSKLSELLKDREFIHHN